MLIQNTQKRAVNYYYHFPKDCVKPYGLAHEEGYFQDAHMAKVLKSINCELLCRPSIGWSEMAQTVDENFEFVNSNMAEILEALPRFLKKVTPMLEFCKVLSSKNEDTNGKYIIFIFIRFVNVSYLFYLS